MDGSNVASEPVSRRRSRSRSVMAENRDYHPLMNGTLNINGNSGAAGGGGGGWGEAGRPSKPKHMNPNRTTMNEMKRRVAGILEFVSRTQIEMAVANGSNTSRAHSQGQGSPKDLAQTPNDGILEGEMAETGGGQVGGAGLQSTVHSPPGLLEASYTKIEVLEEVDFKLLSSVDMMRVLAGKLEGWQREYGRWGEK